MLTYPSDVGHWGISERLRAFVEAKPYERRSILAFVRGVADSLPPGTAVLDIGAGDAPYRELFEHCEYTSTDWERSVHEGAYEVDVVASAEALPLEGQSVEAALLTQVLEHVPEPGALLREAARVLRPGGGLFVTVPFVWELHELPYDFWRFTPGSLERLLSGAGFVDIQVEARNDCFATVAQLLWNLASVMGRAPDGRDGDREVASKVLAQVAEQVAALAELDVAGTLPLGWSASARRP